MIIRDLGRNGAASSHPMSDVVDRAERRCTAQLVGGDVVDLREQQRGHTRSPAAMMASFDARTLPPRSPQRACKIAVRPPIALRTLTHARDALPAHAPTDLRTRGFGGLSPINLHPLVFAA